MDAPFLGTPFLGTPFLGTEALRAGVVRKHQLRSSRCVALFPGVYVPADHELTFADRVEAAWLWSHRQAVVAGLSASRLHGAQWVPDTDPVELIWTNARTPPGIRTSALTLLPGEAVTLGAQPVTSLARTAFDLARRPPLWRAVETLDALGAAAPFDPADVLSLVERHRGERGVRQVPRALALHDRCAESPKETWLRLIVVGAGYPAPQTQIPVRSPSGGMYYLDMGWPDLLLACEYDGAHHRTDPAQFARDIVRLEELAALGWRVIRIAAGTRRDEVLARLARAWPSPSTLRPERHFRPGLAL